MSSSTAVALDALTAMWASVEVARTKIAAPIARPDDCFTVAEYCNQFGVSHSSALRQLNRMVADGELEEVGRVLVPTKAGAVAPQRAFRPVKK